MLCVRWLRSTCCVSKDESKDGAGWSKDEVGGFEDVVVGGDIEEDAA